MVYRCKDSLAVRLCCLVLAFMMFFTGIMPVGATSGTATTSGTVGTSFYDASTALTGFANYVLGPNSNDKHGDIELNGSLDPNKAHKLYELNGTVTGNGGCYVGYGDPTKGFQGNFQTNETNSVTVSNYGAYRSVGDGGVGYGYVRYGRLLTELGIDETGNASGAGSDRNLGGKALQIVYLVSSFIPKLFEVAFKILDTLNPFRFLIGATGYVSTTDIATGTTVTGGSGADALTDPWDGSKHTGGVTTGQVTPPSIGMLNNGSGLPAAMAPIINYITDIYMRLRGIGLWIVMPMMTVLLLFTVFVLGKSKTWGTLQKYCVRFVFIVLGVPFLGITYTAVLDMFQNISANQNRPSTRVVAGTLVDFGNWCAAWRLEPPAGATLESVNGKDETGTGGKEQGTASSSSWRTVRNTIYKINYSTGLYSLNANSGMGLRPDGSATDDETFAGMFTTTTAGTAGQQKLWTDPNTTDPGKNRASMETLVGAYQSGGFYTASAWASEVNTFIVGKWPKEIGASSATKASAAIEETVYQMYADTDDANDWLNRQQDENKQVFTGSVVGDSKMKWVSKSWNIFKNGGTLGVTGLSGTNGNVADIPNLTFTGTAAARGATDTASGVDPSKTGFGLSSLSMYNYLATAFNEGGINVYSAENSTSEYTKVQHYAVGLAGTGVTKLAFMGSCIVLLGIYVVLGFYYAVGMVISVLKHGFSMIMAIPASMFGVMKSIVQVCAYVVQMITEILSSVWLYQVVMELVLVFATVVETPIKEAIDDLATSTTASALAGGVFADAGMMSLTERIAECRPLFAVSLFTMIALSIGLCVGMVAAGKAVLSLVTFVHYKVGYMVTFDEFKPAFADSVRKRGKLDVWDGIAADGRRAIGAAGRAAGRIADAVGREGMPV